MKHFIKRLTTLLTSLLILACMAGCEDKDEHVAIPIAPILKEIKFPGENDIMPGQTATITGLGFSKEDKMYIVSGENTTEVEVTEVTDNHIKFIVPKEAGGEYTVIIERAGKQTTLNGTLKVPFVVPITNIELPAGNLQRQAEVYITGEGFEAGDVAKLIATFYPEGTEYDFPLTMTSAGAKFTLSEEIYGVNSVIIVRGNRRTSAGTITIETNVGDAVGGGIVFWVDATKAHGFIVNKSPVGTSTEPFGPEVAPENAAGTSQTLGSGASNTEKIVTKMARLRAENDWPEWRNTPIAAEFCAEHTVTEGELTYSDWFLPSREELIELFKVKSLLIEKGANIPPNNYWTSSEPDGNAGWAAYYVNFYEETNIVSEFVSKSGWKIGVLPVRAY